MSNKKKKVCTTLNYTEHFLILAFAITGYVSISAFVRSIWYSYRKYEIVQ